MQQKDTKTLEEIKELYNKRENGGILFLYVNNKMLAYIGFGDYKIDTIDISAFNDIQLSIGDRHQVIVNCDKIEYRQSSNNSNIKIIYQM